VDLKDGSVKWTKEIPVGAAVPAVVAAGSVFVVANGGGVSAIDPDTGKIVATGALPNEEWPKAMWAQGLKVGVYGVSSGSATASVTVFDFARQGAAVSSRSLDGTLAGAHFMLDGSGCALYAPASAWTGAKSYLAEPSFADIARVTC
jgi:hypothetical protein